MRLGRLVIAIFAIACLLAGAGVLAVSSPASAALAFGRADLAAAHAARRPASTTSTSRSPTPSSRSVDLSGWQLYDCYQSSGAQKLGTDGNPLPAGTTLPAGADIRVRQGRGRLHRRLGRHLRLPGHRDRRLPAAERERRRAGQRRRSRVTVCRGHRLDLPGDRLGLRLHAQGRRRWLGLQDTDDNAADFSGPSGDADGTPCGAACAAPPAPTAIDAIQGSGETSPLLGDKVEITGTVIGVDNQQDVSDYVNLDPRSAGIYVETPTADQDGNPPTSEGIFVGDLPGRRPDRGPHRPDRHRQRHRHQPVRPDDGRRDRQHADVHRHRECRQPAGPGRDRPDQAAAQTVASDGYRPVLQLAAVDAGRRSRSAPPTPAAPTSSVNCSSPRGPRGSSTWRAIGTPLGPAELLDIAQDAGSADVDPTNPDLTPSSTTRVNANLFDTVLNIDRAARVRLRQLRDRARSRATPRP